MIKYSEITKTGSDFCTGGCGQRFVCPSCGGSLCLFCEDGCPDCDAEIDWSK